MLTRQTSNRMRLAGLAVALLLIAATGATAGILGASHIDEPQLQFNDNVLHASFVLGQTDIVIRVHMLSPFHTALLGAAVVGVLVTLVCWVRGRARTIDPTAG